jgi:hypothetical protein
LASEGWRLLKEEVENQIRGIQAHLGGDKFESLSEVARLQGELQAIKRLLYHPQSVIDKANKEVS